MNNLFSNKSLTINLSFEKPIFDNIKSILFYPNHNINYSNKSFISYFQSIKHNDYQLLFNGFFKDGYFVIIIDSINNNLNISIYKKNIILIKLDWELTKFNNDISLWKIKNINKNYQYININARNFLEDNNHISVDDIISIYKCISYNVTINKSNKSINNKILSIFN